MSCPMTLCSEKASRSCAWPRRSASPLWQLLLLLLLRHSLSLGWCERGESLPLMAQLQGVQVELGIEMERGLVIDVRLSSTVD